MKLPLGFATLLWLRTVVYAQRYDGQYWPCNPMKNVTCPPNQGLNQYSYSIDFTRASLETIQSDWSASNYATITYNTKAKNGAEFTYGKRFDAPQLFTNFHIFFGRVDVEMQVAPGIGMISSSVLMSDDFDEIDWEMSGNNFNLAKQYPNGVVQNNYFSKGITGLYDRGQWIPCRNPQTSFHTYSVNWTPDRLDWILDGKVVRTFLAKDADTTTHQFPQTPAKIQIGLWSGGDPDSDKGTRVWAGGYTNLSAVPYTMFVKSVRITNYNPARYYNWTDQSGSWKSIKGLNISLPSPTPTVSLPSTATSLQPLRTDLPVSPNGHCGSEAKAICKDSLFGDCCSFYGYCGNTTEYCGLGCQEAFGLCGAQNDIIAVSPSISTLTGENHDESAPTGAVTATTTAKLTGSPNAGPSAVPVDKPSWQFCYWFKRWYCYEFQYRRSYPVA